MPGLQISISNSCTPVGYRHAINKMEGRISDITNLTAPDLLWGLEHEDVYTLGRSASVDEVLDSNIKTELCSRGGKSTYHGKGQKVYYIMMDLRRKYGNKPDVKRYIYNLEEVIIQTLGHFGVNAIRKNGIVGVLVYNKSSDSLEKIASIGVRVSKWVTSHGVSINLTTDLSKFDHIIPCGLHDYNTCSVMSLGLYSSYIEERINMKFVEYFINIFEYDPTCIENINQSNI